ncbi:hypothetical protein CQW23_27381 [Capsicum baccatum]|uniref:DYW domain-containing protein n=1 Tax=Capsicum baccatum TaxID=33114 RepID=A0A2G2VDG6_CAPBA|nr:hypothetical protein CQW23_27381 [Capsicum baccatum]
MMGRNILKLRVCDQLDEARRVFEHGVGSRDRPESVWVAMGIGYLRKGCFREALLVYREMLGRFIEPGNFAFAMALKACSLVLDLRIVKTDKGGDQVVYNALLGMYSQCGCFRDVLKVFEEMPERNVVSWNSLIAGFVKKRGVFEAFETFRRMQGEGILGYKPDTRVVLHDVSEETKPEWICGHSERLATVYGLIQTGPGVQMRLFLNSNENVGKKFEQFDLQGTSKVSADMTLVLRRGIARAGRHRPRAVPEIISNCCFQLSTPCVSPAKTMKGRMALKIF